MMTCQKAHGSAYVRIGVTGSGQKPCYRVFHRDENGGEVVYVSYWDMGEPLENESAINSNWSKAEMSFAEIDALLKERINWKPKA